MRPPPTQAAIPSDAMGDSSVAWICADRSEDEDIVYADSRVHNGLDAFPARDGRSAWLSSSQALMRPWP